MDARLARVLKLESDVLGQRSAALVGAPITVNSALNRTTSASAPSIRPAPARPAVFDAETDDDLDGSPEWPPAEVEAVMSAEVAERDATGHRKRSRKADVPTLDGGPLPELKDMIRQIPTPLQEQLDELFRAKFIEVRRVPAAVLKANQVETKAVGAAPVDQDAAALPVEESDDD